MPEFDHKKIEKKWQDEWNKQKLYQSSDLSKKKKFYCVDMFPYPSGAGLHVGHPKGYIASDVYARFMMLNDYNVLHPMGFDSFGLPAENYAIKHKIHPEKAVLENIDKYKKQLKLFGFTYDWSREVITSDPDYYKWTQWIFLQMFKAGLAYESNEPIIWCPSCKTGLANEDLEDGKCERCGSEVEKKPMRQWVLKITDYAEKLLEGLKLVDWEKSIIDQQINWIGKSEGALIKFELKTKNEKRKASIEVFTTRADTIFSGTFIILAPEHKFIDDHKDQIMNFGEVLKYRRKSSNISDMERSNTEKNITGVRLNGITAKNPATGEDMPVWVADFVLAQYGTGAVFADAHDLRDFRMAKKYGITLKTSIIPDDKIVADKVNKLEICFEGDGILYNSGQFSGLGSANARPKIISWLNKKGLAKNKITYKMRDWVFSRQRYWGEPIPLIHCDHCAKEKEQVYILHGWEDSSQSGFIPLLKENLEQKGYEVHALDLPQPDQPDFDVWYNYANKKISNNNLGRIHIIGHSMGAHLSLKLAERYKLESLSLIAPVGFSPSKEYFSQFKGKLSIDEMQIFKKYQDRSIDVKKIRNNVKNINFIFGEKDPWITSEIKNYYEYSFKNIAKFIILENYAHMSESEGVKKLDEIEKLFKISMPGIIPVPEKDLPVKCKLVLFL
ncbi:MAG: leucine--tRNA ligase, partial [Patescibacteria group bacterium]|nr:leucine--tRNA ligase [Patescibacteria group bacterium]